MLNKLLLPAALVLCASVTTARAEDLPTRFGTLSTGEDNVLVFKGRPVQPPVEGNFGLGFKGRYTLGASDVVLVEDTGGTGCPAQFYFITVTADGARATKAFGTCADDALVQVQPAGDEIQVVMSGFQGPFESASARRRAAAEKHVFVFRDGAVRESEATAPAKPRKSKKAKATGKPWTDRDGFMHFPDGTVSSSPSD